MGEGGVPARVAATPPSPIIFGWADDFGLAYEPSALVDLTERLRRTRLLFGEDGALLGAAIVAALRKQATNIKAWPERSRLRFAAIRLENIPGAMGLL